MVTTLPKILTVADWRAKKGLIATAVSETGVTAALKRLKTAFDKVPWRLLQPSAALANTDNPDVAAVKAAHATAQSRYPILRAAQAQAVGFGRLAHTTMRELKGNKLVPAATIKHVGAVALAAEQLRAALDPKLVDKHWLAAIRKATPPVQPGLRPRVR